MYLTSSCVKKYLKFEFVHIVVVLIRSSIEMNKEQLEAFDLVKKGKNLFITGAGGVGKSFLLSHIVQWAKDKGLEIAVTASTGCAAYLIQGRTIHSYLGIGLAKKSARELADYVRWKKPFILSKLKALQILMIDEISMINDELFEKISEFLSIIRGCALPFGGLQIILCGDFAQLPPTNGKYCFLSKEWIRSKIEMKTLTQLMRQSDDDRFRRILEELRWGICSKETKMVLQSLKNTKLRKNGIIPTILYSMNVDVDSINEHKYSELIEAGAEQMCYKTTFSVPGKAWAASIKIPEQINLCVGTQVVSTWNMSQDNGLVNGSRGVVTSVTKRGPMVRFTSGLEALIEPMKVIQDDNETSWISFIPLKLAYALTIHKSQGMTLDAVVLDLGDSIFEYGQAYTALSRARSLDTVRIVSFKKSSFRTHEDVMKFYGKEKL